MRPALSEQLAGVRRILGDVVAPAVDDAYAADVLLGLLATLDALAAGWAEVPAYLAWDTERSLELLVAAGRPAGVPSVAEWDVVGLEARHTRVRELLAAAVVDGLPPDVAHQAADHFRQRAERYPLKAVQAMPGQRSAG